MSKQKVTLFYRNGCHLCDDMWQHLVSLQNDLAFDIETIDIDASSDLTQRYGTLIPVLEAGGKEICHYYLDEVALRNYLSVQASEVS